MLDSNAMTIKKRIICTIAYILISTYSYSQDLKAGEINITHISGLTYQAKIILYQNTSTFLNRPKILVLWGDGAMDSLTAQSSPGCGDTNTTTKEYITTHTFSSAPVIFTIWCHVSFRMDSIQNISNSSNEDLILKYDLNLSIPGMYNSSPLFLNCAHQFWYCCNWSYDLSAYDPDLDSLSYKLIEATATNYSFPPASIDSVMGNLTFNPTETGLYSFCIQVDEWRKVTSTYILVGTTYRQIQIDVYSLTGIDEYVDQHSVTISPNPFSSEAVLESDYNLKNVTITIENCFGQTVKQIKNINGHSVVLTREDLSNGIYFVRLLQSNTVIATRKIIITD